MLEILAAILGEFSGRRGAGKEPSDLGWGRAVGGDPQLRHPGQWHLNVHVEMWKPSFHSFIQQVFIEDQLLARCGSGFWGLVLHVLLGKHTGNSVLMGKIDKTNNKGEC